MISLRNFQRSLISTKARSRDSHFCQNPNSNARRRGLASTTPAVVDIVDNYDGKSANRGVKKVKVAEAKVVRNPSQIQMISDELYKQVFVDRWRSDEKVEERVLQKSRSHLEAHSLWNQTVSPSPSISFKIPPLEGTSIEDHFRNIAKQQTWIYKARLKELVEAQIPEMPTEWKLEVKLDRPTLRAARFI